MKFLRPEVASSGEWTARFLTEARALAALKHRNLVEVFEFGATADGFQYLMMEFIEGTSLEHYLAEQNAKGQLPLAPAVARPAMNSAFTAVEPKGSRSRYSCASRPMRVRS